MRLNVTHKMTAGFVLMVILILVVGAGGLLSSRSISTHFFNVSDQVIPALRGSMYQLNYLEAVNTKLFTALSQSKIKDLNNARKEVKAQIELFNQEQDQIVDKIAGYPELIAKHDEVKAVSSEFFAITDQVITDRKNDLILEFKIRQAEIQFNSLVNTLNLWTQSLYENNAPLDVLSKADDLSVLIRTFQFYLTDFQGRGNVEALNESLGKSKGELKKVFSELESATSDVMMIKRPIKKIESQLYGDDGLVDYYNQKSEADKQLQQTLVRTNSLIGQAQQSMNSFIELSNQLTADARTEADGLVKLSHIWIIGLSLGAVVLGIAVGLILVRTIQAPLAHIHQGLSALREGNLGVDFVVQRQDEFGDLCNYLNSVVEGLKDIVTQVSQGAEQLADVANKNAAISQQTTQSMDHQSEQLEQTSSAAVEMEHSVSEVATHSKTTLQAVHEFEALSRDVSQQMMDTIASIETQADGIDQAMGVSKEMSEFGEQIVSILTSIQGIADKTNLLALNAAIEAARAGEQGRGFAVVADEVRALAGQTGDSVQNIQQMIESLQEAIRRVSVVMDQSYKQTQNCVEQAGRSQNVLKSMNDAVSHIRELNAFIENAATEQSQAVAEVSQTLVAINAAAAETSQGAGSAAQSSHKLLEVVQKQQGLLSRFSMG